MSDERSGLDKALEAGQAGTRLGLSIVKIAWVLITLAIIGSCFWSCVVK